MCRSGTNKFLTLKKTMLVNTGNADSVRTKYLKECFKKKLNFKIEGVKQGLNLSKTAKNMDSASESPTKYVCFWKLLTR